MKRKGKLKLRDMSNPRLIKRYNYLKSKLSPKADDISNEMKYIKYHAKQRGLKV